MTTNEYAYPGTELELFAGAGNWKRYFSGLLQEFIGGEVLEVGAGIGSNTPYLLNERVTGWTCLEPDTQLASQIKIVPNALGHPISVHLITGTIQELPANESYDCILYIDVLEHIQEDETELAAAADRLKPGGSLIVLSPAYQSLMSPFDHAIGHFRRYNRKSLQAVAPVSCKKERIFYADCLGMVASMANRLILRQRMPDKKQVRFWNNYLVPVSRMLDKLIFHQAGKSIIGIWKKIK